MTDDSGRDRPTTDDAKREICTSCGVKVAQIPGFPNDLCGACANLRDGIGGRDNAVDRRRTKPGRGRRK